MESPFWNKILNKEPLMNFQRELKLLIDQQETKIIVPELIRFVLVCRDCDVFIFVSLSSIIGDYSQTCGGFFLKTVSPYVPVQSSLSFADSNNMYKTIVISGESGAGKSMLAGNAVAQNIRKGNKDLGVESKVVTIYFKLSGDVGVAADLNEIESTTDIEKRNENGLNFLKKLLYGIMDRRKFVVNTFLDCQRIGKR